MKMHQESGFTVVELVVVIMLAIFVGSLFWVQKSDVRQRGEDTTSKQDINAIYYYLEGVYFPLHHGYPATLTADQLKGLDPDALRDESDMPIGSKNSAYLYKPSGCQDGLCTGYQLSASLGKEADFTRTNNTR